MDTEQSSSRREGIAADPGWGSGKELDLMGQGADWRGERERERGGSAYWWVLVLVLSEQTTAWFSLSFFPPFGVFGWVLFGYVLCPLSLFSLSSAWCCLLPPPPSSLSLSSEEGNGTTFF